MASKSRSGEIASLLESFLDDTEDDLSYNVFQLLEGLGDEIERIEDNYLTEAAELKDEKEELEEQVRELEATVERLEEE